MAGEAQQLAPCTSRNKKKKCPSSLRHARAATRKNQPTKKQGQKREI
jgi:hypothetical protein